MIFSLSCDQGSERERERDLEHGNKSIYGESQDKEKDIIYLFFLE